MARTLAALFAISLLTNAFCLPADLYSLRRSYARDQIYHGRDGDLSEAITTNVEVLKEGATSSTPTAVTSDIRTRSDSQTAGPCDDTDDDDEFDDFDVASSNHGGGFNIFSLLNLVNALIPGSNGSNVILRNIIREFIRGQGFARRHDTDDNEIDIDDKNDLKRPPFQRQETNEDTESEDSHSESIQEDTSEEEDNAAEEIEVNDSGDGNASQQDSDSNDDSNGDDSDYDFDEPPGGGDGQGGGLLGLLAGLSGGEDGQSDLGSLLATVGGIVADLSGDGFDLNAIIASGLGLFVGLLSEGEENPGAVIASFLLTSLDTITGGGSKNNGAFFGSLLSKLVTGTSAFMDPDASSEEEGKEPMKDSFGFIGSFLMALLGDMSKSSSAGSSH